LKGSALTMGFERMGRLAHRIEDVLRAFQEGRLPVTAEACDALFESNDAISIMLDTLAEGKRIKVDVESSLARLARLLADVEVEGASEAEPAATVTEPERVTATALPVIDTVRVPTARLDELVNLVGETVIGQIRVENELETFERIRHQLHRLRLRKTASLPRAERVPRGRSRLLEEVAKLGNSLADSSRRLQEAVENSGRLIKTLQHRTMELRMLPLALVFKTLPRAVRDLSRQSGKKVNFRVEGEQTTLDKRIVEQIGAPLIHLLRNALDHGLETPEERCQCGKPEKGNLLLRARQEGGKVIISLEDDGRGIDCDHLKQVAVASGFVKENELEDWTEAQLLDLIFLPGFSTSTAVTEVSGRGVGMDVVRANVERLNGEVHVSSELGKGTRFVISLPLTLAAVHALTIQCAGEVLAAPAVSVAKTLQLSRDKVRSIQGRQAIVDQGEILPLRNLALVLGWQEESLEVLASEHLMIVVLQAGERKVAFLVEEILGEREIVTKDLGSHLSNVEYVSGTTILGSGEVALILDVPALVWQVQADTRHHWQDQPTEQIPFRDRRAILVVEDQVVTRQMEKSILEAAGYRVVTAENGLDALTKLQEQDIDLVITDIQMPKMDGFALTRKIRSFHRTKDVPVVVVTSMEREEDKRRGLEVGADAYLIKSAFDQKNLIDIIEGLLGQKPQTA
ncbi:MAG: response regulator, partial [Syntrophobacteria bacterium]